MILFTGCLSVSGEILNSESGHLEQDEIDILTQNMLLCCQRGVQLARP